MKKFFVMTFILMFSVSVFAEKKPKKHPKKMPQVIDLGEEVIEGKITKPEVFYILSRTETHYKLPINKESFIKRIEKSVEDNPF